MKTFEGSGRIQVASGSDDWRLIFPIYLLRALSVTTIISLFFYTIGRLVELLPDEKFQEFILNNITIFIIASLFLFFLQFLVYIYRSRRGTNRRRSIGEIVVGYALPLIGIIAALYVAYAVGAM